MKMIKQCRITTMIYRPTWVGFAAALKTNALFLVAVPSLFVIPVFTMLGQSVFVPSRNALVNLLLTAVHLLIAPLLIAYTLSLTFFGRTILGLTSGGRALIALEVRSAQMESERQAPDSREP